MGPRSGPFGGIGSILVNLPCRESFFRRTLFVLSILRLVKLLTPYLTLLNIFYLNLLSHLNSGAN